MIPLKGAGSVILTASGGGGGPTHIYGCQGGNIIRASFASMPGSPDWATLFSPGFNPTAVLVDDAADYVFVKGANTVVNRRTRAGTGSTDIIASSITASALAIARTGQLVFYRGASSAQRYADYDGANDTFIQTLSSQQFYYHETPDWLYYVPGGSTNQLRRVHKDGSGAATIATTPSAMGNFQMDFAEGLGAQGTAFAINSGGTSLFAIDIDTGTVTTIRSPGVVMRGIAWSPLEAKLYVCEPVSTIRSLLRMDADGTNVENLGALAVNTTVEALAIATI